MTESIADHYFDQQFSNLDQALGACTHLAIGAHPDDLEVMAGHGIEVCRNQSAQHFFGVTCTTGGGSARSGRFANLSDTEMEKLRAEEQFASAKMGNYAGVLLLGYKSSEIKNGWCEKLITQLQDVIEKTQPKTIYTHNPFDKHLTHVSVFVHTLEALRRSKFCPEQFLGCEVWRGLDWVSDAEKVLLPIENPSEMSRLIDCHQSQTEGGKSYSKAVTGRMKANATFFDAWKTDESQHQLFAIDLLPLIKNPGLSLHEYAGEKISQLKSEVEINLTPFEKR